MPAGSQAPAMQQKPKEAEGKPCQVIIVVDCTGSMKPHWQFFKDFYLLPVIQQLSTPLRSTASDPPQRATEFALVEFQDLPPWGEFLVRSYPFTSDSKQLETWINEIQMSAGGHSTNAVAEGLASCLQLFDFEDRARPKICILVANSYPYEHECRTPKAVYAGGDCYSLADSFAEKQILLSIFMPRKIERARYLSCFFR